MIKKFQEISKKENRQVYEIILICYLFPQFENQRILTRLGEYVFIANPHESCCALRTPVKSKIVKKYHMTDGKFLDLFVKKK